MYDWILDATWSLGAFILFVLVLLVAWLVISVPGFGVKQVLETLGLREALDWGRRALGQRTPAAGWRLGYGLLPGEQLADRSSVRVVADERLHRLTRTLANTVQAISRATQDLVGLGGTKGPGALAADVTGLQSRIEEVALLGGEIDDDLPDQYRERSSAAFMMWLSGILLLFFAVGNGMLLNLFFREQTGQRLFGVPVSLVLSVVFIISEFGIGLLIGYFHHHRMRAAKFLFIALVGCFAITEAIILGLISYNFQLDVPLLEQSELSRFWMSLLGFAFVTAICGVGFVLHDSKHRLDETRSAKRLRRDVKQVNRFIQELPGRWDRIRLHAQTSEAAIQSYVGALGNKAGALKGAVDQIATERQLVSEALVSANPAAWSQAVEGNSSDVRELRFISIGLGIATVVAFAAFTWGYFSVLSYAYQSISPLALLGGALLVAVAYYSVGLLSFGRLQLMQEGQSRVFPLRSQPWEYILAGVAGAVATIAVLWAAFSLRYVAGPAIGLGLVAGGVGLALLGYAIDKASTGLAQLARILTCLTLAGIAAAMFVLLWTVGGFLIAAGWIALFILAVIAWPLDRLLRYVQRNRAPTGPTSRPAVASAA